MHNPVCLPVCFQAQCKCKGDPGADDVPNNPQTSEFSYQFSSVAWVVAWGAAKVYWLAAHAAHPVLRERACHDIVLSLFNADIVSCGCAGRGDCADAHLRVARAHPGRHVALQRLADRHLRRRGRGPGRQQHLLRRHGAWHAGRRRPLTPRNAPVRPPLRLRFDALLLWPLIEASVVAVPRLYILIPCSSNAMAARRRPQADWLSSTILHAGVELPGITLTYTNGPLAWGYVAVSASALVRGQEGWKAARRQLLATHSLRGACVRCWGGGARG